jgi:nitrogen fixation/metabolism regulation signal transduction histidine kinase
MTTSNFPTTSTGRYKRSVRNLLIDSRFQLKYTGILVLVAIAVSSLLGGFLYRTSREVVAESARVVDESARVVEESKKVSDVVMMSIKDNYGQDGDLAQAFNEEAQKSDQKVLEQQKLLIAQQRALVIQQQRMFVSLVAAFAALVLLIGGFGIWFTHKISGPIYKMKILLRQVGDGRLVFQGKLRKGDELQDFFEAFSSMVDKLRDRQGKEVAQLDAAIRMAGAAGASQESLSKVQLVRDEMKRAIDG